MSRIHSFPHISNKDSRILILGSMPGKESLAKNEYYAHPRNSFWKIMKEILNFPEEATYSARKKILLGNKIALWDVLQTCTRKSSLDSDIIESTIICNDFKKFYRSRPKIKNVFFNGKKVEAVYMKYVYPNMPDSLRQKIYTGLPSTSPANARYTLNAKIKAWRVILK